MYYPRIVKPNPESESESFLAISTINMKAFTTTKAQSDNEFIAVQSNYVCTCVHHEKTDAFDQCLCV